MSQQVISYADLSIINNALRSMRSDMSNVTSEIGNISIKQDNFENELLKLADAFSDFIAADLKNKALQLAETRQGNLKQDLNIKFGYYAEVRRMSIGILQAVDNGIVSDQTLRSVTEEVMIKSPGYWLASSLVALTSWIRNDIQNNEKALQESLKQDDYKTTLFFMLVMRRLSRYDASLKWLERYFMHQNPHDLDREFIIILEAVTTGIFPPASRQLMMKNVSQWILQLTQNDDYINKQKEQWIKFFETKEPSLEEKYPLLQKFATNWTDLDKSMREAKTHKILKDFFNNIFSSSSNFSKSVKIQLDEILSLLVTNFDDEELPLQQKIRLNELIIQMDGDKAQANAVMDTENYMFNEKIDFLQILTNASFNPELSGASKATQALSISISLPWIIEAHDTFTANSRNKIPNKVNLNIDGFTTSTEDGKDEEEQLMKHNEHWDNFLKLELKRIRFPYITTFISIFLFFSALSFGLSTGLFISFIGMCFLIFPLISYRKKRKVLINNTELRKTDAKEVLRGCIAETVDYRIELSKEDLLAEELNKYLKTITPEDFSSSSKNSRNIIQTN